MLVAQIAIPRPNIERTWDYLVPGDLADAVKPGMRVLIPIGSSRVTGYVTGLNETPHISRGLKPIQEILDDEPLVSEHLLELTRWAADYYLTSWGDMIKAALPAGINVEEREVVTLTDAGKAALKDLRERALVEDIVGEARDLLDYLTENGKERIKLLQTRFSSRVIGILLRDGWIEPAVKRTGRRLDKLMKAVKKIDNPAPVPDEFWTRSASRKEVLNKLSSIGEPVLLVDIEDSLGISKSVIDGLQKAGLVEYVWIDVRRNPFARVDVAPSIPHQLRGEQIQAFDAIAGALTAGGFTPFVLHGVTGSGKTEIYIHAALKCLEKGREVLILIPELALTPQFVRRYYSVFGDDLAVLHSALGQGERIDEWNRIRRGAAKVVLGTRLSIFAPTENIGLIVVDEEHDASYKQDDYPAFSARDLALLRAQMTGAVCILGSATPSLETLYNASTGKFRLLRLNKRVLDRPLPKLNLVDLRQQAPEADSLRIPPHVLEAIETTLEHKEQTLVLVGRKGFSPFVLCRACGFRFECRSCSITMSYHEKIKRLKCHYCGRSEEMPAICPECGSTSVEAVGIGTEKVEEGLISAFPAASVARMDRDIITRPYQYGELLERLRKGEIDILVGTQMIAKGHDYPGVTCVVAMGLDMILGLPDFRHAERVFQLIRQISGRAGRGERPGEVFILTYKPDHYAIKTACENDLDGFLDREFDYRRRLRYPPFGFLALLTVEDFDKGRGRVSIQKIAELIYAEMKEKAYVLGPSLAPYARLKNRWRHQIMIKAASRSELGSALRKIRRDFKGPSKLKINIDPVSVM
jgi:primosomal protein N' (replication factor Y)